jgi:TRAP-type transport system small permease protein
MASLARATFLLRSWFERLCFWVAAATLAIIFVVLCVNVFVRYLRLGSFNFGAEVPEIAFPWLIAACIGLAALHSAHISVSFLTDRLPAHVVRWVGTLTTLVTFAIYGLALYLVADLMPIVKDDKSPILKVSLGWTYAALALAFITVLIAQLAQFFVLLGHKPPQSQSSMAHVGAGT